ncbi:MAG: ATP-binding cassette domain-containing protein [Methanobacteriota archaeon]
MRPPESRAEVRVETRPDTPVLLSARRLARREGAFARIAGLSLEVRGGEAVALIGPNGAGKSTAIRLLAGLSRPSQGEVRVLGRDAFRERALVAPILGVLLPEPVLPTDLSARDALALAARLLDVPAHRVASDVARTLEQVEMSGEAARPVASLSRGERHRLELARALLGSPRVLLLDQPFALQDRSFSERLAARLHAWKTPERAIVLAVQETELAARVADRILLLSRGRAVAEEPARRLPALLARWPGEGPPGGE